MMSFSRRFLPILSGTMLLIFLTHCKGKSSSTNHSPATGPAPDGEGDLADPTDATSEGSATTGETSGDETEGAGEDDGGNGEVTPSLSGSVGTVMLATNASNYAVTAYEMNEDGTRGAAIGTAPVGADGSFDVAVSSQPGVVELALESTGLGLVETTPVFRTRVKGTTESKVALNAVSELFVHRSDQLIGEDKTLADALLLARTETSVLTGIKNVLAAPAKSLTDDPGDNIDAGRYALVLAGLTEKAKKIGVQDLQFISALKDDFADGAVTGSNGNRKLSIGDKEAFNSSYEDDLRSAMKDAITLTPGSAVKFNDIPTLSGYAATSVQALDPSTLAEFTPTPPTVYAHYFRVRHLTGSTTEFSDPNACLGPFDIARVDGSGAVISTGPELPIEIYASALKGASSPVLFSDAACTGGNELAALNIAQNTSSTAQFYIHPKSYYAPSFFFSVNPAVVASVDTDYISLSAVVGGKRVAVDLGVYLVDNPTGLPANVNYIGQAGSELQRDVCYPGVLHLFPYVGFLGAAPAAYPTNVSINNLTDTSTFSGDASCIGYPGNAGAIGFYSDAACSSSQASFTVNSGNEYLVFYMKVPAAYTRCYNSQIDRLFFIGFSSVTPSFLGVGYSSYNYYIAE